MTKFYTGIGSRKNVPVSITDTMSDLAVVLYNLGYVLRSGRAEGSDYAFQRGAEYAFRQGAISSNTKTRQEIYIPNDRFNTRFGSLGAINPITFANYSEAESIAEDIHPAGVHLRGFAREAHIRNVYQILGRDLNTPSEFVVCYAPINTRVRYDAVTGGTATAYELARRYNIPRFNLIKPHALQELMEFINVTEL